MSKRKVYVAGDTFETVALTNVNGSGSEYGLGNAALYQRIGRTDLPERFSVEMGVDVIKDVLHDARPLQMEGAESRGIVSWWDRVGGSSSSDKRDAFRCTTAICRYSCPSPSGNASKDGVLDENDVLVIYNATRSRSKEQSSSAKEFLKHITVERPLIVLRTTMRALRSDTSVAKAILEDAELAGRTVAVVSIESIRRAGLNVRRGLSWEQILRELASELWSVRGLGDLRALVVTSHREGVITIWPSRAESSSEAAFKSGRLDVWFVPNELEGTYDKELGSLPMASLSLVAASIAAGLREAEEDDPFSDDISFHAARGLYAARALLELGYTRGGGSDAHRFVLPQEIEGIIGQEGEKELKSYVEKQKGLPDFPYRRFSASVRDALVSDKRAFSILNTVQEQRMLKEKEETCAQLLRGLADDYVHFGRKVMDSYPRLEFGNLLTYDRGEIEQLNNLKNVLRGYIDDRRVSKPLSVCVFGRPGAGKSFAVKEIASHLGLDRSRFLEFNLSQMEGYADLASAFHRVADAGLGGMPLVFFDEFDCVKDSMELGWLRHFLAPMQDGAYREGDSNYAIGRAVFVFAGGTCATHQAFIERALDPANANAKGKDFQSRTKAFVDIVGINGEDPEQPLPYVKRAVLLRSLILRCLRQKDRGQSLEVDDRVLDAFLEEEDYHHDARSMEAIVTTSDLCLGGRFTPACIVNNCLDLHVSSRFNARLNGQKCFGNGRPTA